MLRFYVHVSVHGLSVPCLETEELRGLGYCIQCRMRCGCLISSESGRAIGSGYGLTYNQERPQLHSRIYNPVRLNKHNLFELSDIRTACSLSFTALSLLSLQAYRLRVFRACQIVLYEASPFAALNRAHVFYSKRASVIALAPPAAQSSISRVFAKVMAGSQASRVVLRKGAAQLIKPVRSSSEAILTQRERANLCPATIQFADQLCAV